MITQFTTYAEIRSLLGVSDEEVQDSDLAQPIWSSLLEDKLSEISDNIVTLRASIAATPEADRTAAQKKFFAVSGLYAAYVVAQNLLIALPMFGFKQLTDGKAEVQRFDRWADLKAGVEQGVNAMRVKLRLALSAVDSSYTAPTPVTRVIMSRTGIATDPVTGA